jgi:hypothetical protein
MKNHIRKDLEERDPPASARGCTGRGHRAGGEEHPGRLDVPSVVSGWKGGGARCGPPLAGVPRPSTGPAHTAVRVVEERKQEPNGVQHSRLPETAAAAAGPGRGRPVPECRPQVLGGGCGSASGVRGSWETPQGVLSARGIPTVGGGPPCACPGRTPGLRSAIGPLGPRLPTRRGVRSQPGRQGVVVADADDLLDDDRAFVEIGGGPLVHTSVAERFVEQFVGQVRPLAVGERASGENAEVDTPWCRRPASTVSQATWSTRVCGGAFP